MTGNTITPLERSEYFRVGAVRLMLPGHTDEDKRLLEALKCYTVVEDVLEEYGIDMLELLSHSGDVQQEYYLIGHSYQFSNTQPYLKPAQEENEDSAESDVSSDSSVVDETTQAVFADGGSVDSEPLSDADDDPELTDETDSDTDTAADGDSSIDPDQPTSGGSSERRDTRPERIKAIVKEHLTVGAQICTVDLSTLGVMPVPTSRLLQSPNMSLDPIEATQMAASVELIQELNADRIPYLFQVLLEPAAASKGYDYLVTARLIVFGSGHGIVTKNDLSSHLKTSNDYTISKYFPGPSSDNWQLPVESHQRYANQQSAFPSKIEQFGEMSIREGTTESLAVGYPEYRAALAGRVHNDDRYKELFGAYGRIPIHKTELEHFFTLPAAYIDTCPFGRLPTTDKPGLSTEQLGEDVDGTAQSYGTEDPDEMTIDDESNNEESQRHKKLVNKRIRYLLRHGHTIIAVDQDVIDVDITDPNPTQQQYLDGSSRPDIVSKKDGNIHFHEIEVENKSKPAALITNLARADYHGHPVHIITETHSEAQSKLWKDKLVAKEGPVSMAFKYTDDKGTILYNQRRDTGPKDQECWYVLPQSQTEAIWRITPSDRLQLLGPDGEVLAEGHAERSVDSFQYNTPRVYEDGNEWVLESASGEILRRRATKRAAASGYTFIRKPIVPTQFEYLEATTVEFQTGDGFTIFDESPLWEMPQQNNSIRYEEAAKTFIELFTVPCEGAEIPIPALRRQFKPWYRTQTDLKEPNETWFGRALRAYFEVDASDDHNKMLVGRKLRFSEGLESPDLPFVDDET
jgi:hypothetical protein